MTKYKQPPSPGEPKNMVVEYAMFYPTEKVGNNKKRRTVMLISMPICPMTKSGFRDTIEGYLHRNGITVVRLSNTVVAVVPDTKFVEGQVDGILATVARYRELKPDQLRRRRLSGSAALALRSCLQQQLPVLYERLAANSTRPQLVIDRSG